MAEARRVVLDTNTVLSALLFVNGRLVPLRTAWQSSEVTPLLCAQTVEELLRVLAYPKFKLTPEERVANFRVAKTFMNDTIVDALGIRAFGFTLKLERCSTAEDLINLLPAYTESLLKKVDREAARALVERTRELLLAARG